LTRATVALAFYRRLPLADCQSFFGSHREINHVKQTTLFLPAAVEAVSS